MPGPAEEEEYYQKYKWHVPISIASPSFNQDFSKTEPVFWINKNETAVDKKDNAGSEDWLIVNVQTTGNLVLLVL